MQKNTKGKIVIFHGLLFVVLLGIAVTIPMKTYAFNGMGIWDVNSMLLPHCQHCKTSFVYYTGTQLYHVPDDATASWCGVCCQECGGRDGLHRNILRYAYDGFLATLLFNSPCTAIPQLDKIGVFSANDVVTIRNQVFCAQTYAASFVDLRNAFGAGMNTDSAARLWNHFRTYALSGREPARLNGFSPVFQADHYLSSHADLRAAAWVNNGNNTGALLHFIRHGMNEARNAHPNFIVRNYRSRYGDLERAFGNNWNQYYRHFVHHGRMEGRNSK